MMMDSTQQQQLLPRIDFSRVDVANPGADGWDAVRSQVVRALESHGCFEAIYDKLSPDARQSVLSAVSDELFALPLETKRRNTSPILYGGYLGGMPGLASESLAIPDPLLSHGVPSFTSLLWPDGNPKFRDQVSLLAEKLGELEEAVRRMLVEGLGVDDMYHVELSESNCFLLRFWEYGGKQTTAGDQLQGYVAHRDVNTLGVVCQLNEVEGLEVQTKGGLWITLRPSPTSFIVIAGDALRAWTNGRVHAPMHRIVVDGKAARYSAILFSIPKDGFLIQAPPELVDDGHPSLFRPYYFNEYLEFCGSEEGKKAEHKLDAFCGIDDVERTEQEAAENAHVSPSP